MTATPPPVPSCALPPGPMPLDVSPAAEPARPGTAAAPADPAVLPDWMTALRAWDAAGIPSAEAILVSRQHSSPRFPGARLVANARGDFAGSVSMGCVENDLRAHLAALLVDPALPPRMVRYGAAFDPLLEVGLSCGGEIGIWLRRHDPDAPAWQALLHAENREKVLLWTRLDPAPDAPAPDQGLWHPGLPPPEPADPTLPAALKDAWDRSDVCQNRPTRFGAAPGPFPRYFLEVRAPAPLLILVGASPIAVALARFAPDCGWRTILVDPRTDYARADLFPPAVLVVHEWPDDAIPRLVPPPPAPRPYLVLLAHDQKLDLPALRAALALSPPPAYLGLLGSTHTRDSRYRLLAQTAPALATPEKLATIHSPVGLKTLGGVDPAEIAISILAEMISIRRHPAP
ncbi:MAG: XdhC family protein [Kiritimatiellae bacterium]|nr:XdhC family protein [Kiritimatiellia bacterium]